MPPRTAYSPGSRTVVDAQEAVVLQPMDEIVHADLVADRRRESAHAR